MNPQGLYFQPFDEYIGNNMFQIAKLTLQNHYIFCPWIGWIWPPNSNCYKTIKKASKKQIFGLKWYLRVYICRILVNNFDIKRLKQKNWPWKSTTLLAPASDENGLGIQTATKLSRKQVRNISSGLNES